MADRRICALRVEVTPGEPRVARSWSRAGSTATGATSNGCRSTRRARSSRPGPGGRSGPAPSTCASRPGPPRRRRSTWRCARIDTGVDLGYAAATTVRPAAGAPVGAPAQRADHRADRASAARPGPCGWTSWSRSAPRATRITTGPCATAAGRCWPAPRPRRVRRGGRGRAARCGAACGTTCDCEVVGNARYTRALRFCVYHLLIAANPEDPTVNIGAKSLSGEGYRGHVFWDTEIFMLPFFILTQPDTAQALLRYRHHTLDGARANSREYGTGGARYAWESADTGREECPQFTPDGANRFWTREEEIHVSADVAYGIFRYVEATGDTAFLHDVGAEVLFETSRFWVDRVEPRGRRRGLRAAAGDGPGRVPLPHRQQRLHQPPRAVAPAAGRGPLRRAARPAPRRPGRRSRSRIGLKPEERRPLAGGRRRARRPRQRRRRDRAVHRLLRARRRPHHRVGRQRHAPLPEGLPPLQLRDDQAAQAARRRHADATCCPTSSTPRPSGRTSSTTRRGRCTSRR